MPTVRQILPAPVLLTLQTQLLYGICESDSVAFSAEPGYRDL